MIITQAIGWLAIGLGIADLGLSVISWVQGKRENAFLEEACAILWFILATLLLRMP